MMGRALLIVGGFAVLGFVAAGVLGFHAAGSNRLREHLLVGFVSVLLLLLSQVWMVIFLLATGSAIRRTVALGALDPALVLESRQRLRRTAPWLLLCVALTVATFAVGPEVIGGGVPRWLHAVLASAALISQVFALLIERRELGAHAQRLRQLVATVAV